MESLHIKKSDIFKLPHTVTSPQKKNSERKIFYLKQTNLKKKPEALLEENQIEHSKIYLHTRTSEKYSNSTRNKPTS